MSGSGRQPPFPGLHAWVRSDRAVPRRVVRPLQEFLSTSTAGAALLLAAAIGALVWANSPWHAAYDALWRTEVAGGPSGLDLDLRHWVNDGLMSLFFLVVALEIKRELLTGELRDPRAAALPAIAAVGGMVTPALIYLGVTFGDAGAPGWGVPIATDIAFALGVLALAAGRAPASAKPFLLTLAIVDDIGAIVVIGVVYAGGLSAGWLLAGAATVAAIAGLQRLRVGAAAWYLALGVLLWYVTLRSGLHPTIAGVVLGLLTPARPIRSHPTPSDLAPLVRVEHLVLPWSSFVVVPLFALANAGVRVPATDLVRVATGRVTVAVVLGLVVGKVVGISAASWLAVRLGLGRLPSGVAWSHLVAVAALGGIGFTVSLFVAELAFDDALLVDEAKVGIIVASVAAGAIGLLLLRRAPTATPPPTRAR